MVGPRVAPAARNTVSDRTAIGGRLPSRDVDAIETFGRVPGPERGQGAAGCERGVAETCGDQELGGAAVIEPRQKLKSPMHSTRLLDPFNEGPEDRSLAEPDCRMAPAGLQNGSRQR